jgi:hypothetical protein
LFFPFFLSILSCQSRFARKRPSVKRYDCSPVYKGKKVEFVVFLV